MVYLDDRILELLDEEGPKSPSEIESDERFFWSRKHIGQRCRELHEHGLVDRYGRGVYGISEEGQAYLAEELDVRER